MSKTVKDVLIIICSCLGLTALVWLPFLLQLSSFYGLNFSSGFATIYRNFDGLNYIVIAKTFYDPSLIIQITQSLPASYFPAHFPGYPLLIALFAPLLGYLKSMLFVSVFFTIASAVSFYFLLRDFKLTNHPLWLSIIFLILPARWLIVHSVGSAEPIFIFFTIVAIYFFKKFEDLGEMKNLWISAIFAALAQLTRSPGILLLIAIGIYLIYQNIKIRQFKKILALPIRYFPFMLVPLTLLAVFTFYGIRTGDFLAYFHSGDNIHLTFPPFQVFNKHQFWVGDIWLEDIIYIFLLGFMGGFSLLKTNFSLAGIFVLTYLVATISVAHRDVARYSLPIIPFLIIAFEKVLVSREFKIVIAILFLGLYLYTQNFLIENTAPAANLEVFN